MFYFPSPQGLIFGTFFLLLFYFRKQPRRLKNPPSQNKTKKKRDVTFEIWIKAAVCVNQHTRELGLYYSLMRYFMVDVALPSSTEEEGQEEDLNNNRVPLSYILSNHR
jgi:hypothetical protein